MRWRDGDAELVDQLGGHLAGNRDVPAADEHRGDRSDRGIEPGRDAPLDAAQIGLGRRHILLAGEQQRDVDRNAGEDRLLDGRQSFLGAGNLDEEIGLAATLAADRCAAAIVRCVSWASSGETSSETQPSTPSVRSKTGRTDRRPGSDPPAPGRRTDPPQPSRAIHCEQCRYRSWRYS